MTKFTLIGSYFWFEMTLGRHQIAVFLAVLAGADTEITAEAA
jgi:hypothetical protein